MKIVELYIEENDDESGVESLSWVSEPATHQQWLVFNNESECNGSCELKKNIKGGESFSSYIQMGVDFRIEDLTETEHQRFYSPFSTANQSSREDNSRELVRYYYAVDTGLGANLIKESRELCRDFIFAGLVYRDEDLSDMSRQLTGISGSRNKIPRKPGADVDLKDWKMGKQCRHIFRKLTFKVPEDMTPEQFASTLPTSASQSFSLASTNTYQDGVAGISNRAGYIAGLAGFSSENRPMGYLQGLIVYPTFKSMMDIEPKVLGWSYVDIEGTKGFIAGIPEDGFFEDVTVEVIKSGTIEETFYTDYPESAKEAARVAVKRNEELGNPCATQVGKIRAQQIIRGENLSYETIKRTYSYLSRAKEGYEKAKSEGDYNACSYISYGLWGGDSMLNYTERVIRQEEEDFYGNTGCIGTLITEGVGELEAIYKCSKNRRAHITKPYYDPTDDNEYSKFDDYVEDREMVDGIIELLVEIDDIEERKKVAYEAIDTLTGEGVSFDLDDFITRLGLKGQMTFGRQTFKDDLKYEITTVVMEPDRYIVRKDHYTDELYYCVFTKDTVKKMSQKFFKMSNHKNFNLEHTDFQLNGGYVYESWLVGQDPKKDKAYELGFNVNAGTWMVSLKWEDKEEFEKYVLSNETLGISLEGNFLSRDFNQHKEEYSVIGEMDGEPIFSTEEEALERASVIGCSGTHKHGEGWMACSSHSILLDVRNSSFANEYDIFIEEVKDIINKK